MRRLSRKATRSYPREGAAIGGLLIRPSSLRDRLTPKKGASMRRLRLFWKDKGGATALEYALIGGMISTGLIAAFGTIGTQVANKFPSISNALN
jgi:pilus assembly protein Flp/PilA